MIKAMLLLGATLVLSAPVIADAAPGHRHGAYRGYHHGPHYRGYFHSRVFISPFYAYPRYYYPAPVYYAPAPAYYAPAQAPVYVEQQPAPNVSPAPDVSPAPQGEWFYCGSARAYYPDVATCAEGWQRVPPR